MKTPSDELFRLIKSLNKQEKIHFSRYSSRKKEDNHSLKLFHAINRMNQYDEEKLKKKLKDKALLKNLKRFKSYTYRLIIRSLRELHSEGSAAIELQRDLQAIEILYEKRLFDSARKIINKAEKKAAENDAYQYLLAIADWKYLLLLSEHDLEGLKKYSEEGHLKKLEYLNRYKNLLEYQRLNALQACIRMPQEQNLDKKSIRNLEALLRDPLLKDISKAVSYPARVMHYRILGNIYWSTGNFERSRQYTQRAMRLFEENPLYQQDKIIAYIGSINNMIGILTTMGKSDEVASLKNKADRFIRGLPAKLLSGSLYNRYIFLMNNYINYQIESLNIGEALKCSEEVRAMMEKYGNADTYLAFYGNLFKAFFFKADHRKALQCINKILTAERTGTRQDIFNAAGILEIIVHYDLGNEDMISLLCKRAYKDLRKRSEPGKTEMLLLDFFQAAISKAGSQKERTKAFTELKEKLEITLSDPFEKNMLQFFDLISWAESKVQNRPFAEIAKEKTS